MVLNFVKPDTTADVELVMSKLKEALQKSDKPEREQQAATWRTPSGQNFVNLKLVSSLGQ